MKIEDVKIEKLSKKENESLIDYVKEFLKYSERVYEIDQHQSAAFCLTCSEGHIIFSVVKKTLSVSFWYNYHELIRIIDIQLSHLDDKIIFDKLIGLYDEWLKNIDELVEKTALKSTFYVYTSNNGDGSVTPMVFATEKDAENRASRDEERYCDDISKVTIYLDKDGKVIPALYDESDDADIDGEDEEQE